MNKETAGRAPILIDLGKKRRKLVRQLRRGRGRLLEGVTDAIEGLQSVGKLDPQVQTVIVIVAERRPRKRLPL